MTKWFKSSTFSFGKALSHNQKNIQPAVETRLHKHLKIIALIWSYCQELHVLRALIFLVFNIL